MEGIRFGRYVLECLLGEGGMGRVYQAFDTQTDRRVAVKVLPEHAAAEPMFRERFRREARAAASLGSPYIVPIYDFGEIDGRMFICMQLVDGCGLDELLDREGPFDVARATSILNQAAAALTAAHAVGLVHRDVKPSNLLVTASGFVYLIDFGIARAAGETGLTTAGAMIGTFAYMAPERFVTGVADARADIYALACVLYQCLTAATPFPVVSMEQQIAAHLTLPPPLPSKILPSLGTGFDEVIRLGMAKDPDERFQSAGDLAAACTAANATRPEHSPIPGSGDATAPKPEKLVTEVNSGLDGVCAPGATPASGLAAAEEFSRTARTELNPNSLPLETEQIPSLTSYQRRLMRGPAPRKPRKPRSRTQRLAITAATAVVVIATASVIGYRALNPGNPLPTIAVGKTPIHVAVDSAAHTGYVGNYGDNTVSVFDTSTKKVTDTIRVGSHPDGLVVDPSTHAVFVANQWDGTVSVIDTTTNRVTSTILVGKDADYVALDPDTHSVYVTTVESKVAVINTVTRTVTDAIEVPSMSVATAVAVDSTLHVIFLANLDSTVSVVDSATHKITDTVPVGHKGTQPTGIAVDPGTHTLYVVDDSDSTVSVIDTATHKVVTTISQAGQLLMAAADPGTHTVYITNMTRNSVSIINTTNNKITESIRTGKDAEGVTVDLSTHTVYIANGEDNVVSIIDR